MGLAEKKALSFQPQSYQIYLKNLVHTVSRNIGGQDQVCIGQEWLDKEMRQEMQWTQTEKFVIPEVQKVLCQSFATKQDTSASTVDRSFVKVMYRVRDEPLADKMVNDIDMKMKVLTDKDLRQGKQLPVYQVKRRSVDGM